MERKREEKQSGPNSLKGILADVTGVAESLHSARLK